MQKLGFLLLPLALGTLIACGDDAGTDGTDGDGDGTQECTNISGTIDVDGLTLERPREDTRACQESVIPATNPDEEDEHYCTEVEPDLSCLGQSEPLGTPATVTMTGCVVAFGLGTQTTADLTVAIFAETEGGSPVDPGYDVEGPAGAQDENTATALFGTELSVAVEEDVCEDLGEFSVPEVPTETPLIVRVTDQNLEKDSRLQVDTYQYNIILRNKDIVDANGGAVSDPSSCTSATCFVTEQVNTINKATFFTIPRAAGVSSIDGEDDLYDNRGEGHVAGEIQDCTSENTLRNASVAVDSDARRLTYFNVDFPSDTGFDPFNYDDPKPQSSRRSTNADGLYTALGVDTMPGGQPITVGAALTPSVCGADGVCMCTTDGKENPDWTGPDEGEGETISLGSRKVFLFPDSVTILTFDRNIYTAP